jgi:hypothetical protein
MMSTSIAIVIGSLFDLYSFHYFTYAWTMAAALSGGALIDLGLCFPQEARLLFRRPYLRWFGYAVGIGLAVSAFFTLYDFQNPTAYSCHGGTFISLPVFGIVLFQRPDRSYVLFVFTVVKTGKNDPG